MNNKEFDRSVCFQFYESYLEQAELVKEQLGYEMCAKYFIALVRYGLYQEESDDPMIKMLISGLKNTIDAGQTKRARGFNGKNKEKTEAIIKYKQEHPDASQREIANVCGCSIGKVNKVINSNSNLNSNNNINNNSNSNLNINSVNVNMNTEEMKEERDLEDLTDEEGKAIIEEIHKRVPYKDIQKKYHLKYGIVTKNFPKQWQQILSTRAYLAEQAFEMERRKNEPQIDYDQLYARVSAHDKEKRKEEKTHQEMFEEVMNDVWIEENVHEDDDTEPNSLKIIGMLNKIENDDFS